TTLAESFATSTGAQASLRIASALGLHSNGTRPKRGITKEGEMIVKYESDNHAVLYRSESDKTPVGFMQATFSGIWVACPDHGFSGYFPDKNSALLAADAVTE